MEEYFEKFGKIEKVTIISRDGRSKGMKALAEGEWELDGRKIGLSWAEDKKEKVHPHQISKQK